MPGMFNAGNYKGVPGEMKDLGLNSAPTRGSRCGAVEGICYHSIK
jgi:hypothetical protein